MRLYRFVPLLLMGVLLAPSGCHRRQTQPNLLLITIDTIRPDHLGCEGYSRAQTPHLDQFAIEGVQFLRCMASVPITLPSHTTIMTGLTPIKHGVRDNTLYRVPEENTTLAELMKAKGYTTAAFISGQPLTHEFGLAQGFDHYDDDLSGEEIFGWSGKMALNAATGMTERPADQTASAVIRWLTEQAHEPFFIWVHFFDPHQGYQPPPPYSDTFFDDPYDGEIAFVDEQIGRIFAALDHTNTRERTSIVITGDHGEGLMDHGEMTHATLAYDSTLRVPLMWQLVGDDVRGRTIDQEVGLTDIRPSMADHLGFDPPSSIDGIDLLPLTHGEDSEPTLRFFENESMFNVFGWARYEGMRDGTWKYIHSVRDELYNIGTDPDETENLFDEEPEVVARLQAALAEFKKGAESRSALRQTALESIPDDVRDRLAALGYLGPSDQPHEEQAGANTGFEMDRLWPADHVQIINEWSILRSEVNDGKFLDAEARLRYLLAFDPGNTDFLDVQAMVLGQTGRENEAIKVYETLMSNGVAKPRHLRNLAMLYKEINRLEESQELFTLSLGQTENIRQRSIILAQLADLRGQLGDTDGALKALVELCELRPEDFEARRRRAVILYRRGDTNGAESLLEQALACNPYHARSHQNLAAIRLQQGRIDEAVEHARISARVAPQYLEGRLTLGIALMELGRPNEARQVLEALLETAPSGTVAQKTRGLLAQLDQTAPTSD